jgi:hypothetical protein
VFCLASQTVGGVYGGFQALHRLVKLLLGFEGKCPKQNATQQTIQVLNHPIALGLTRSIKHNDNEYQHFKRKNEPGIRKSSHRNLVSGIWKHSAEEPWVDKHHPETSDHKQKIKIPTTRNHHFVFVMSVPFN